MKIALIPLTAALISGVLLASAPAFSDPAPSPGWRKVDPENLILLSLENGTVAIELFPEAAPAHAEQIRRAVRETFFDGEYFYRVVDGHVAQAGREFDKAIADWPSLPFEAEREISASGFVPLGNGDLYAPAAGHRNGFAVGRENGREWLLNCTGAVGMARDDDPDSGITEFYIPLQPRRYLDRNYTVFGRVIDGMDVIHRLPRVNPASEDNAALINGDDPTLAEEARRNRHLKLSDNQIIAAEIAADMPESERPVFEVMDTTSLDWAALKHSKRDYSSIPAIVSVPPKLLDICSLPVPARRVNG